MIFSFNPQVSGSVASAKKIKREKSSPPNPTSHSTPKPRAKRSSGGKHSRLSLDGETGNITSSISPTSGAGGGVSFPSFEINDATRFKEARKGGKGLKRGHKSLEDAAKELAEGAR